MILRNPTNGAKVEVPVQGKIWRIEVGDTLNFEDDSVALDLLNLYGFLEVVDEVDVKGELKVEEIAEGFKCSGCDYTNKIKVAVMAHQKGCKPGIEAKTAEPVGDAPVRLTIQQARAKRTVTPLDELSEKEGFYGDGLEESRPGSGNINGVPGRFGTIK